MRRGFTLIEVLAAVAVAALIVSAAYGVVASTITAQRRTEELLGVRKEGAAILDLVCEDLAAAVFRDKTEVFVLESDADPSPFHFMSVAWDPASGRRTLGEVGYLYERNDEKVRFFRRFDTLGGEISTGGNEILVSDEVVSWKTECFDGEEWHEMWEHGKSLPVAVRIEFSLAASEGKPIMFKREVAIPATNLLEPFSLPEGIEE